MFKGYNMMTSIILVKKLWIGQIHPLGDVATTCIAAQSTRLTMQKKRQGFAGVSSTRTIACHLHTQERHSLIFLPTRM